jgi:hypothetical protein
LEDFSKKRFIKWDWSRAGALDAKEVSGLIEKKQLDAADPDNDGRLTKEEYLSLVDRFFKEADADNEGTLDSKELHSKAGRALKRLID